MRINLFNPFAFIQRARSTCSAKLAASTSHQTLAKRSDRSEPPLDRRTDRSLADARSAVHHDDADRLQKHLNENPELFTRQFGLSNETLLTEAARAGKINAVQTILTQALTTRDFLFTAIVNHQNAMGNSALMLAIEQGHLDVVDSLLAHPRTRLHITNKDFKTPLHLMAEHPDVTWAPRLRDRTEIIPNLRDRKLDSPQNLAVKSGSKEATKVAALQRTGGDHALRSYIGGSLFCLNRPDAADSVF